MWRLVSIALTAILGVTGAFAADEPKFSEAQLEEMVAPIALYPDELLTQICIAATYPLEVVEAQRWVGKNPNLKGDALDKALAQEDWDDSVKWLTHFPDVLKRMSDNLEWTQDLGNAFLEQQAQVMDAAQRMRAKAADAGTLKTTSQQTVIKEKEVIRIEPADPQVVYVPQYAPATVYGPSYVPPPAPYYPSFWGTPGGALTAGVIGFGVGIGTAALFSSAFDWNNHDVYVNGNGWGGGGGNVNVNKNVNVNNQNIKANGKKWEHNAEHRRGVGYRDQQTAQKFGAGDRAKAQDRASRDQARGRERSGAGAGGDRLAGAQRPGGGADRPGGGANRPGAGQRPGGGADRPGGGANGPGAGNRPGGGGGGQAARPATRPASGGSRDAFSDRGGGNAARQASQRGAASRGSVSRAGGGGGHGGGGGRGGGGGGGRGGGGGGRGGGGGGGGGRRR